jgi:hypothetical protein
MNNYYCEYRQDVAQELLYAYVPSSLSKSKKVKVERFDVQTLDIKGRT